MRLGISIFLFCTSLMAQYPSVTALTGRNFSSGSTTLTYYVMARFPDGGVSGLQSVSFTNAASLPSSTTPISISWNPAPGAIAYDVMRVSGTPTTPVNNCDCAVLINTFTNNFTDTGITAMTYTVLPATHVLVNTATTDTATLTVAQLFGGRITGTPTAAATYTTPTATLISGAFKPCYVGSTTEFIVRNTSAGANTITLAAGTGVTLTGTMTIAQNNERRFIIQVTNCNTAVTIFSTPTGAF